MQSAIDERIKKGVMIFIKIKYSHMSKENPTKKYKYKSGESGNPTGRPKGSLNRKTIAREYLAFLQEEVNP
ncbi:DUF5681 domain-containing protein [Flavobacteriaceae bacterium]|nr:DUF5681 domain-containing protein [Flavobacteriaceae bacterium]